MKLSVMKSVLLEGLQKVQNVVSQRTTLPILSNVLVAARKGGVELSTTDLDVSVRSTVEAQVEQQGETTLPVKRLASIVRELPEESIEIEVDEKDTAAVNCGSFFFKIIGLSAEEFPPLPKAESKIAYRMDQGVLKEMLRRTAYAASVDETRYVLNGVYAAFKEGKLTLVATDGRRLALCEHEMEIPAESESGIVLPSKGVQELMHNLGEQGELRIFVTENQAVFEFGTTLIATKLVEGTYPNYRQVIPPQSEERIVVEREGLLNAVRRVSLVATDKTNAAKLTFAKNRLTISMSSPDIGEAKETMAIKYGGKDISVAFNAEFVMDPLKNLATDEVAIEITDDMSPGVIKCDTPFLYVIMPMRIT